jgi:hypothetical protein
VYYSTSNKKLHLNYDEKKTHFFNVRLAREGEWGRVPLRSAGRNQTLSPAFVEFPPGGYN